MTLLIERLAQALREELQQYGELLALLELQQRSLASRDAAEVERSADSVSEQTAVLEELKDNRRHAQDELNRAAALPSEASLSDLILRLPPVYQPLMNALIEDINLCLQRIRRLARQNHALLSRSVDMMGQLIESLSRSEAPRVYNAQGAIPKPFPSSPSSYQNVC